MPNYLSPGVYVEEVSSGSKPIEGAGTAVAAFVGFAVCSLAASAARVDRPSRGVYRKGLAASRRLDPINSGAAAKDRSDRGSIDTMMTTRRARAVGLLAALMMPLGAAVHVVWEFAGVGVYADFGPRHSYLLAILGFSIALLLGIARGAGSPHDRRRALAIVLTDLPYRGRGMAFVAVAVGMQLSFAALTLVLEGATLTPLGSLTTLLSALVAALIGAFVLTLWAAPLLALAAALTRYVGRDRALRTTVRIACRHAAVPLFPRVRAYALFVPNRPPPDAAAFPA